MIVGLSLRAPVHDGVARDEVRRAAEEQRLGACVVTFVEYTL
jgi:hypothetical protein